MSNFFVMKVEVSPIVVQKRSMNEIEQALELEVRAAWSELLKTIRKAKGLPEDGS